MKEINEIANKRDIDEKNFSLKQTIRRTTANYVVKLLLYTPITANQVSVFAILLTLIPGILFAFNRFNYSVIAIIIMFLSELMDTVDGGVARCKNQMSKMQSYYLCMPFHRIGPAFLLMGIATGVFVQTNNIIYLIAGFVSVSSLLLTAFVFEMKNSLIHQYYPAFFSSKKSKPGRLFVKSKFQNLVFELVYIPITHLGVIILIAFIFNKFALLTIFYSIFLLAKACIFSVKSYFDLKNLETGKIKIK